MTRPMTGQPETVDELTQANCRAQQREHETLQEAGLTRTDLMDAVEEIDDLEEIQMAWGAAPHVEASYPEGGKDEAAAAVERAGYEITEPADPEYAESYGYLTVTLGDGEADASPQGVRRP